MKTFVMSTLALLMWTGAADAQSVHNITFQQKILSAGGQITLDGTKFVMVYVPVADFGGPGRYAVGFLTPIDVQTNEIFAYLNTQHSNETIANPVTISGYPGQITVSDSRTYLLLSDFQTLKNELSASADAVGTVRVKVGATMLSFFISFSKSQQAPTPLADANQYSALGQAQWSAYVDPLVQVTAVDNYIDYIRIIKLN